MMDPASLRTDLERVLNDAVLGIWADRIPPSFRATVTASDNLDFGDLSCQAAMKLAGVLRDSPRRIAGAIAEKLDGGLPCISAVTVDGPGYINLRFSDEYLASTALRLACTGLDGLLPDIGGGREANVEFVSSNPTGPLTVGHCRQAVLGETLAGLLEAVGWKVTREYYYNDGGRQMRLLGRSLAARYAGDSDCSEIPEGGYHGEYLERWAEELLELRGPDLAWESDADLFIDFAEKKAMEEIRSDLSLLGIRFDRFFTESLLIPEIVPETVRRLSEVRADGRSIVFEDREAPGKLWLRLTSLGRPKDRVIRREDGTYTYRMPDIAYHLDKFSRGYDLIVDVFGSDHVDTSRDVAAALAALLGDEAVSNRLRIVIHQFVTLLRGGEKVRMSTRSGDFVTLRELVEEVGSADVTKYLFLTRRAEAHMDFDLDLAVKQSMDNPVYYVQYAHARISGIMRTARDAGIDVPVSLSPDMAGALTGEHEREMMRLLESVPLEVAAAAELLEPHRLTDVLAELAAGFHRFYQHVRVVDDLDPAASSARLMLCEACRECIRCLLRMLGVDAPDRM